MGCSHSATVANSQKKAACDLLLHISPDGDLDRNYLHLHQPLGIVTESCDTVINLEEQQIVEKTSTDEKIPSNIIQENSLKEFTMPITKLTADSEPMLTESSFSSPKKYSSPLDFTLMKILRATSPFNNLSQDGSAETRANKSAFIIKISSPRNYASLAHYRQSVCKVKPQSGTNKNGGDILASAKLSRASPGTLNSASERASIPVALSKYSVFMKSRLHRLRLTPQQKNNYNPKAKATKILKDDVNIERPAFKIHKKERSTKLSRFAAIDLATTLVYDNGNYDLDTGAAASRLPHVLYSQSRANESGPVAKDSISSCSDMEEYSISEVSF